MAKLEQLIKRFSESKEALIQEYVKQSSGFRTTRRYTGLMNQFIRSLFFAAGFTHKIGEAQENTLAIVALGGYGRRELCFGSDVDLMVIHKGSLSPEMNEIITRALYSLWDAKLEVGHSILTVQQCIRLAMHDFRVLTSVMDGRFLLGSRPFFRLFQVAFRSRIEREKESLINQFLFFQEKRKEKYGTEGYFVEPDIKEGLGGLRDLNFMAWMARIYFGCKRINQIKRFAVFSHFGFDNLNRSGNSLLKVRNHLHLLAGRKEDRLLLSLQKELSHSLGFVDGPHISGSDKFMRELYLHLNRIRYGHEEFLTKALDIIAPLPSTSESAEHGLPQEFKLAKGNIVLKGGKLSEKDPLIILKALCEANQRGLFLGSGLIWEARKKIATDGKKLLVSPGAQELFLEIFLNPKNPKIMRLALEIGLVTLFIPEFKRIRNLAQSGFYHVETMDLHSLRTVETINEISKGTYDKQWPLLREVFEELENAHWLFLASLLHDIGKGYGEDHSRKGAGLIPRILNRLGIKGKAIGVIPFLVREHLLLARISQRRDLGDEKTSVQVAQVIQDKDLLQMLFLLTVADSIATGPIARSNWRIMLLIELFIKVRHILIGGVLASPDATKKIEANKKLLIEKLETHFQKNEIMSLIEQLSSRYFLNTTLEDMVEHFRLALTMGQEKHLWKLQKLANAPVTRVIQCTYDKPGLFSKMVGVFTLNNIKVLSANIFTLKNGLAFDVYEVTNPPDPYREDETWEKIRGELSLAMEDRLQLGSLLLTKKGQMMRYSEGYQSPIAKKIEINNEISDFFTFIEVSTGVKVGLLYELTEQIFSMGLDIRFGKFNRDKEKMTGVFYVRDSSGQKIQGEGQLEEIKQGILSVLK
ncbi:MAG: [protein-PII] uridylyltransferase [Desulfobacteraceae bacterium]|nr:MAG: [protein-PII] uridylyltransferase [Desulfobacteraceae bacterium]